jgi:glycosyltransferase involved in cell wall biosynthesis
MAMETSEVDEGQGAPGPAPRISVILCTRNRAALLRKALESLASQDMPRDAFEIILVDNASSDATREVAHAYEGGARLRYVLEERIGLCIARNTGWRAARGEIVAYFDDDAIAAPGWVRAVDRAFSRPDARRIGVVGGPAEPIWEVPRPDWLPDEVAGSLTIVDWGPAEKVIPDLDREWLVGANMAMPRAALEAIGGFHPGLDRVGSNLLSSGDIHVQKRLVAQGLLCLYAPDMLIRHLAAESRLKRGWFLRRFYWQGVSDAAMHLIDRQPSMTARLRAAAQRAARLLRNRRRLRALMSCADAGDGFALRCFALIDVGFIVGLLGAAGR